MSSSTKVSYIFSHEFLQCCDQLPKLKGRASIVHSLIKAYGLLNLPNLSVLQPVPASGKDLERFHSKGYVSCLQKAEENENEEDFEKLLEEFGIGYDCPVFEDLYHCLSMVAGGTLRAAESLNSSLFATAINWCGGWHHAHRDEASGYCYVNDIVLGILKLKEKFKKILYIDLDLHHGDGVQEAFFYTPSVFTLSFHKYTDGFFPGTGSCFEIGLGKGKHHCLNIPLLDGMNDSLFVQLVNFVVKELNEAFQPDAIVCQCGVDGLVGDPMNSFNLTHHAFISSIRYISSLRKPLLLLGGGGYNFPNAAKCWTLITAMILDKSLPNDIPEHKFFTKYGPDYTLAISPHHFKKNKNSANYLARLLPVLKGNLTNIC
ncbi:histone deacetylase 8-like isoform X3 [Xenia sp. Carnegie-2017]|uniref:histone deacetylase 8-like isoform X3 n=1 Tax=Xenia sp. Carnegie-2017 TaxID=2897299 RepID=UPI001F04599B|nr:histone deacetylase 8-like isoform X3 [Xenia sp. Carnegie-2017]